GKAAHLVEVGVVGPVERCIELARDRLGLARVPADQHDVLAALLELARGGGADAVTGSGDDDGPAHGAFSRSKDAACPMLATGPSRPVRPTRGATAFCRWAKRRRCRRARIGAAVR